MGKKLRGMLIGLGLLGGGIEGVHLASQAKDKSEEKGKQTPSDIADVSVHDGGPIDAGRDARVQRRMREWESRMTDQQQIQKIRAEAGLDPRKQPIFGIHHSGDKEPVAKEWLMTEQDVSKLQKVFSELPDFTWDNDTTKWAWVHMMKDGKRGRRLCNIQALEDGTYLLSAEFGYDLDTPVVTIGDLDQLGEVIPMMKVEYDNWEAECERMREEDKRSAELYRKNHPEPETFGTETE